MSVYFSLYCLPQYLFIGQLAFAGAWLLLLGICHGVSENDLELAIVMPSLFASLADISPLKLIKKGIAGH